MPRIPDCIADSAIYLYASERAAKIGQDAGGSGFLIHVPAEFDARLGHTYAVTNNHLVEDSDDGKFWTIRLTKKGGGTDTIETRKGDWFPHEDGDDVAIHPIGIGDNFKYWSVPTTSFLDRDGVEAYKIGYGDDVFLVGRLMSQSGQEKNTPVARFGTIALQADETELIKGHEAFLIECHSISGFSGSPVFVMSERYYRGDAAQKVVEYERKRQPPVEQSPQSGMTLSIVTMDRTIGPLLLGVDFGHIGIRIGDVYDGKRKLPTYKAEVNTGMSGVVPAWKVIDILNHPRLVEDRKREELAVKNELEKEDHRKGSFVLDSARISDSSLPEFTQQEFEDALRKVTRRVEPSEPDEGKK